ncbi:hypothetical protein M0534_12410 [Methylonatrum kenyense]|uniref:hypothetical protein n=1 Tax=Methylonatrum kenyense TaxID=455253 RepID=UPI0020BF149C|nr:hypothetical protein [Methylonatrum kenyense]MCK8517123.1 hypothetical protein [Methylonatrum kenyense]
MPRHVLLIPLVAASLLLGGCRLEIGNFGGSSDDDDNGGGNGDGSASISVLAADAGGYNSFLLTLDGVDFQRSGAATERLEFAETEPDILVDPTSGGVLISTGFDLPTGSYRGLVLRAISGFEPPGSEVDGLPLEIGNASFESRYSVRLAGGNDLVLVINTLSALLPEREGGSVVSYAFRPAGYVVRLDQAGYVEGNVAACSDAELDQRAVYVFREDASVRDIRGPAGSENDPVVVVSTDADGNYITPPLRSGDYQISYTCNALDDDPEEEDDAIRDELLDNVETVTVRRGEPSQATTRNF